MDWAWAQSDLTSILQDEGKLAEAESLLRDVIPVWVKLRGAETQEYAQAVHSLGYCLSLEGKLAEAESMDRRALDLENKTAASAGTNAYLWWFQSNLASVLEREGKIAEAEAMQREALATGRGLWPNDPAKWKPESEAMNSLLSRQGGAR